MTKPKTPVPVYLETQIRELYYAPSRLRFVFQAWNDWGGRSDRADFVRAVKRCARLDVSFCADCNVICRPNYLSTVYDVPDSPRYVCDSCTAIRYEYCGTCEKYFPKEDETHEKHVHPPCCSAPHPHFTFPADGHGVVRENERLTVELAKGTIDEEGISRIKNLVARALRYHVNDYVVWELVDSLGPLWQAKRGNFTKRLSSAVYAKYKIKLSAETISEVGNIAREHSSDATTWHIESTRDLNGTAKEFYHEESCWWTSHSDSRCCLKSWGGLALRTYSEHGLLTGRVWVQPLNSSLQPTHDALNAHAYAIYNGYGDISGYIAARVVAHLAGRTYRKVWLAAENTYVNNDNGYLVADEATCLATDRLRFSYDKHNTIDAETFDAKETAA